MKFQICFGSIVSINRVHNFRYLWMTYEKFIYFLKLSHGPRFPKIFCDPIKLLGDDSSIQQIANIKKKHL